MQLGRCGAKDCVITVSMENKGRKAVSLPEAKAPWHFGAKNVYICLLEDTPKGRKRAIPVSVYSAGLPAGEVVIPGGQSVSKEVSLSFYYNDVLESLERTDVILLWLYDPVIIKPNVGNIQESFGHLTIPKFTPGIRSPPSADSVPANGEISRKRVSPE